jgi:hypothetical protein
MRRRGAVARAQLLLLVVLAASSLCACVVAQGPLGLTAVGPPQPTDLVGITTIDRRSWSTPLHHKNFTGGGLSIGRAAARGPWIY